MKKLIIAVSVALASASVYATQSEIDDLRAGLHAVHMNTLTKYSESWGLEDRANIAKLQETKLDKTAQAATDAKQTSDLKGYADKKATSAYTTAVQHTDVKVARADADRKAGDDALGVRIDTAVSAQACRDAGQDQHINAVQEVAQNASVHADALAVRADGIEQRAAVTDDRSIHNAVRLDGVEKVNGQQEKMLGNHETRITQNSSDIVQLYSNGEYAQSRIDAANANIEANRSAQVASNKRIAANSQQLADHEQRIVGLEQDNARKFANIDKRFGKLERKGNAGTATALAAAGIPQVTGDQRFAMGAAVGGYESENALAIGFSSRVSDAVVLKASVASDSQSGFGYNAGFSVGF